MWQRREGPEERTGTWRRVYDCKRGVVVERRRKDRSVGPEGRRRVSQEMRRDANWVGLNDGLSPGLESLCCGSGNFMGH